MENQSSQQISQTKPLQLKESKKRHSAGLAQHHMVARHLMEEIQEAEHVGNENQIRHALDNSQEGLWIISEEGEGSHASLGPDQMHDATHSLDDAG